MTDSTSPRREADSEPTGRSDMLQFVGWFDSAEQTEPTYEPPFPGPCIVCMKPMSADDVRTYSLMWADRAYNKSVFYRMHRTCAESLTPAELGAYDGAVLDAIPTLNVKAE